MTRRIYTMLPASGAPTHYAFYENRHARILSARDIDHSAQDEVIVFVPGTDVFLRTMKLPQRPADELSKIALFALEDELAQPVESLLAAIGAASDDGTRSVMVVDADRLDTWTRILRGAGIKQARLVPDISILPDHPYALDAGDRILMSMPQHRFAVDANMPDDALLALTAANNDPIRVMGDALQDRLNRPTKAIKPVPLLACLAAWADPIEHLPDLCQGRFQPKPKAPIQIRALKSTLIAASLCVGFLGAQKGLELHNLAQLKQTLDQQAQAAWANAYPNTPPPTNIAAALSKQIQPPSAPQINFLDATAHLYAALPTSGDVSIESLRYEGMQGQLAANLIYPSHGGDIDLKRELEAAGVPVLVGDSRQIEGRVLGTLTLGNTND